MGMGIVSIVGLMTHNLSIINRVHMQTTATTLAREGMEMITNMRDTNTMLGYERNCAERTTSLEMNQLNITNNNWLNSLCKEFFWTGWNAASRFIIDGWLLPNTNQITMKKITWATPLPESQLFLTGITVDWITLTGYTHQWWEKSFFSRYIEFTGMNSLPINSPLNTQIVPVRSIVQYNRNWMTGEVMFESFIANQE